MKDRGNPGSSRRDFLRQASGIAAAAIGAGAGPLEAQRGAAMPTARAAALMTAFGLKYPIFCAGMGGPAGPDLAIAVSNAGGLGALGGVRSWCCMQARESMRSATCRPPAISWRGSGRNASRRECERGAMTLHVALVHPEIHWNTGNAGRTCLAAGATLHLIEPLGFSLDEKQVRRAGLDYWEHVDLRVWSGWDEFEPAIGSLGEPFFFSTKGTRTLWDAPLGQSDDVLLVFGRETGGLPDEVHAKYRDRMLSMPILSPHVRSLNLSTSVGIALYEVLRQRRPASLSTLP